LSHGEGERRSDERRSGEIGACASRAKVTERSNEKHQTQAITKETDSCHGKNSAQSRQFRANGKGKASIYDARNETFPHRDLRWIAAGYFTREIVINSPTKAGGGDKERTPGESKPTFRRHGKENAAQEDECEACTHGFVHVFSKYYPCDSSGRDSLQIEKERCGRLPKYS
jgi:hypothetical protein